MKNNWAAFLLVGLLCVTGTMFLMDKFYRKNEELPNDDYKELVHSIDSLTNHISLISKANDSLKSVIDTTKFEIIINQENYEKDFIDITNQPIRDDIEFFTRYLSESYERLIDSNNSSTIKAN